MLFLSHNLGLTLWPAICITKGREVTQWSPKIASSTQPHELLIVSPRVTPAKLKLGGNKLITPILNNYIAFIQEEITKYVIRYFMF